MSIQINLLPEARMAKLRNKSKKTRYIAIASVMGGSLLAVSVVLIMLQAKIKSKTSMLISVSRRQSSKYRLHCRPT